jgi:hypothetical protein
VKVGVIISATCAAEEVLQTRPLPPIPVGSNHEMPQQHTEGIPGLAGVNSGNQRRITLEVVAKD